MSKCNDALDRLHLYIDRELSLEEMTVVRHHLEHCPPCMEEFRVEQNVLRFIGTCCRETRAPQSLKARVEKLCTATDTRSDAGAAPVTPVDRG